LLRLIDACLSGPDAPLATIDLLDPTERETLLVAFNDTGARVPEETVLDLFEASARRWPDAIAIVDGELEVSYRELSLRVQRLAREIGERFGDVRGRAIAVVLPRSADLVAAALAIFACGAVWVPLDPDHPAERLRFQLSD